MIKRCLGVLGAMALAAASLSAGSASAATAPLAKVQWQSEIAKIQQPGAGCYNASYPALSWHAVRYVAAPRIPLVPAVPTGRTPFKVVGDGNDYSAVVTGNISQATGTFQNVSSGITEKGAVGGSGPKVANVFSLQLNTQFISGDPACAGASNPSSCQAWQQFVYAYQGVGQIFIQYWLIDYNATCPSGWTTFSTDCFTNSANSVNVNKITAAQLASLKFTGTAKAGGNDTTVLSVGTGKASSITSPDSMIHLANFWTTTEWGVYGDGGGSEAVFGAGTSLEAVTAITATSHTAPKCVLEGFTGETNNLKLAKTPALGSEPTPTMGSKQTNGTTGTKSCATAS